MNSLPTALKPRASMSSQLFDLATWLCVAQSPAAVMEHARRPALGIEARASIFTAAQNSISSTGFTEASNG